MAGLPHRDALEQRVERTATSQSWLLAVLVVAYVWLVVGAPIDSVQGPIQKILYIHPPLAYGAYLGRRPAGLRTRWISFKTRRTSCRLFK